MLADDLTEALQRRVRTQQRIHDGPDTLKIHLGALTIVPVTSHDTIVEPHRRKAHPPIPRTPARAAKHGLETVGLASVLSLALAR